MNSEDGNLSFVKGITDNHDGEQLMPNFYALLHRGSGSVPLFDEMAISPNRNKKKLIPRPKSISVGKRTKKARPTVEIGESSDPQQPEAKGKELCVKELLKTKNVPEVAKILGDRVYRRSRIVQGADLESCRHLLTTQMNNKMSDRQTLVASLNLILTKLSPQPGLENIQRNLKEVRSKHKQEDAGTEQILIEIEDEIKRFDEQRQRDLLKANTLGDALISKEGVSQETLRKELSSLHPSLFREEITTDVPTAGQDQESLQIYGQLQYTVKQLEDLKNKIFDKDNNEVDVPHFPGLEVELNKTGGNIPAHLVPIAKEIREARGKPTEFAHRNIEVLVCAAIHEMKKLRYEELDRDMLLKCGATFNRAKEFGFEVEFAERQLKTILDAHIGFWVSKIIQ
ncbi:hypothetical protein DITRI_Ditri06bG0091400 [Diplodiscus trichospermus]